jgi:hypothetical protein
MYSFTLSLTSALDGEGGKRDVPAALPWERPGAHCIGGCVGPRAGLDGCGKARPHRVFTCDRWEENKFTTYGMWMNGGEKLIHVSTWHRARYDQGHWWRKLHTHFCVYCSSNSSALHTLALFYRLESTRLLSMETACQTARCPDQKDHNLDLKVFCRYEQDLSSSQLRIPWAFHVILHSQCSGRFPSSVGAATHLEVW